MGSFIIKINHNNKELYAEWSTITDSPITYFVPLEIFKDYYRLKYGTTGIEKLSRRLERVDKTGCSAFGKSLNDLLEFNRAGTHNGTIRTISGLYKVYYRRRIEKLGYKGLVTFII